MLILFWGWTDLGQFEQAPIQVKQCFHSEAHLSKLWLCGIERLFSMPDMNAAVHPHQLNVLTHSHEKYISRLEDSDIQL